MRLGDKVIEGMAFEPAPKPTKFRITVKSRYEQILIKLKELFNR